MKIYIDCGHGGADPGAVSVVNGRTIHERDLNLIMAKTLQAFLDKYTGVQTLLSRQTNDLTAEYDANGIDGSAARCNLWGTYNSEPVDLMVSVHNNASGTGQARGYDVIHSMHQSDALARAIGAELDLIGRPKHAIFSREGANGMDYFGIIRQTITNQTASIIVESVFIDNYEDVRWAVTDKGEWDMIGISKLMLAVARGIAKFFGLVQDSTPAPQPMPEPKPVKSWGGIKRVNLEVDRMEGTMAVIIVTINGKQYEINHNTEGE